MIVGRKKQDLLIEIAIGPNLNLMLRNPPFHRSKSPVWLAKNQTPTSDDRREIMSPQKKLPLFLATKQYSILSWTCGISMYISPISGTQWEHPYFSIWGFPSMGVPQKWWFVRENPTKMDDLDWFGGTPIDSGKLHISPAKLAELVLPNPPTQPWQGTVRRSSSQALGASQKVIGDHLMSTQMWQVQN